MRDNLTQNMLLHIGDTRRNPSSEKFLNALIILNGACQYPLKLPSQGHLPYRLRI